MENKLKKVCFTGGRPSKLYGYDMKAEQYKLLRREIRSMIAQLYNLGYRQYITGGALGIDTIVFEECYRLKTFGKLNDISLIVAIPFADQYLHWRDEDKEHYLKMLELADDVVYVDVVNNDKNPGNFSNDKYLKRNCWMVNNADLIVGIYRKDMKGHGTTHCLNYAVAKGKNIKEMIVE